MQDFLTRRDAPLTSPVVGVLTSAGAALVALVAGAVMMWLMGTNPAAGYRELVLGIVGSRHGIAESLLKATPLLILGLGISVAFNASVWNIGAEGQLYMGALFSTWLALALRGLPAYLLWPVVLVAGVAAGALWAGIAGFLRARYQINEIIVTVMMNYVAIFFVQYMVSGPLREKGSVGVGFPQTDVIPEALWLPRLIPRTRLHLGFLIAVLVAIGVHLLLKHTTLGYSLQAVGRNATAARFAGINASRTMIVAMVLSGALAGLGGLVEVFGIHHRLLDGVSPGYGFIAIIVALLGNRQPFQVALAAILLASLDFGAHTMQRGTGVPVSLVVTIEYLMVILIVATKILRTHRLTPVEDLWEGISK